MKKYYNILVCCFIASMVISGCQEAGTSKHGFRVNHIVKNDGPKAEIDQWVFFHIEHKAGDEILSSSRNGMNIPKIQMIANDDKVPQLTPLLDGLEMMAVGDSLEIYIPNKSFPRPYDQIDLEDEITYNLSLIDIMSAEDYETKRLSDLEAAQNKVEENKKKLNEVKQWAEQSLTQYNENRLKAIQKLDSGIEYVIINKGKGPKATNNKRVSVSYYGLKKSDGVMFDNSYKRGRPYSFVLGNDNVIPGWHKAIAHLNEGDMAVLFIPFEFAYGVGGNPAAGIGEKEDLVFLVEIEKVFR